VLNFAQFVPLLVLAPWTGAAADRFDRRRLLLVTQPLAAVLSGVLAGLTAAGLASAALVIGFAVGMGLTSAFSTPAQQALVVSLVPRTDIPSAVALNSMTFNLARALGPAAAAAAVAAFGIPVAFALNSASFLIFTAALLAVRQHRQERSGSSRLRESIRLVAQDRRLAVALAVVAIVGFGSDPVNTLAPAFAHAFGRRDTVAGFIIGAFGAGAVAAAFTLAGRAGSRRRVAAALALLGLGVAGFAVVPWLPPGFVLLFAGGFGYLAANTAATSRLQLDVAESQRGRVMALWSIAFLGLRPLASLVDGAIASATSVRLAGIVLSLPALAASAALFLLWRPSEG